MATATDLARGSLSPGAASVSSSSTTNQLDDEISLSSVPKYRFMTPTSSFRSRRPARRAAPAPPDPDTPTPTGIFSARSRSRARSWAAAAVKTVKSVEVLRSRKSTNTLKRSARKRRGSASEIGPKYHLISIAHSAPRSVSAGAVNRYWEPEVDIPPVPIPRIDKALPSEKPLPQTPDIEPKLEFSPTTSRGLIDAEERPLHRDSPGMPGVKEDWPILSPSKKTSQADMEISKLDLTGMGSDQQSDDTPCGVKLFGDAANRLAGSFASASGTAQKPVPGPVGGVVVATEALSQLGPGPQPGPELTQQQCENPPVTQDCNPFRKDSRVLASLGNPPATPINRNFSYTFDSQRRSTASRYQDVGKADNENILENIGATDSPTPTDRRGPRSKIPRISPGVSPTDPGFFTGVNRPMSPALSLGQRSSIPIPSRFVSLHKAGQAPATPIRQDIPRTDDDDDDAKPTQAPATNSTEQAEIKKSQGNDDPACGNDIVGDAERSNHLPDSAPTCEYITEGGVRIKQISHMSPSGGPQLRISPEAEKVIMGRANGSLNEIKEGAGRGRWRKDGNRDFRMSADSLFGSMGSRRDYKLEPRASLSNVSTPPNVDETASRKIFKNKSADLSLHSPSPVGNTTGSQVLMERNPNISMPRTSNNPFFNKIMTKSSSFIAKYNQEEKGADQKESEYAQKQEARATAPNDSPKSVETTRTSPKSTKKPDVSPPKIRRVPERLDPKRQIEMRRGSPRTNYPPRVSSYRSPDRPVHRSLANQAYESKPKLIRPTPTPNGTQGITSYGLEAGKAVRSQNTRPHVDIAATPQELTKPKHTGTKGVLSNFRGLFSKHKADTGKETPIATPSQQNERLSRKSRASLNENRAITRSPVRYYQAIFGTDRELQASQETQKRNDRNFVSASDPPASQSAPAFAGTSDISGLAMEVLNFVRVEENVARKEKLVKLGKFLIEAVNHSNDAEKAMITAIQAAKQAEVACALAKENAMRIGQLAREWLGANIDETSL